MDLIEVLQHRYTAKAYNPDRRLPEEIVAQLMAALRFSPSSVNAQPWHFIVAGDEAGKARVAKGAAGPFAYNAPKILNASHVVLLCARTTLPPEHLQAVLDQEQADGRFAGEEAREGQRKTRAGYVALHEQAGDLGMWTQKQAYIALGFLLLAAGTLGVDATPMEGFDAEALDGAFGLTDKGLAPAVIVALGYHSDADFNAKLPKSRLADSVVFSRA
ncbi:oxygen-insensitive NAD(P)H nitroreductase [Gluconacetobacter takamatsuzukensis]|uniref:Oxygen-insensitive NAD(P)H nitroreductase n=1 Tax=Gluconacetobacter takamatsuzukensis TaxID=1286190 RepID=A0A7W4KEZ9_9PROT|nr:oxygen-insensitive NAD(P)H nitroreductase [Gluconacetobacter takamatsuzukensis]MBB2205620.1 oxygen-insensitive NAD(P)H nitroreductase [Gluconacetobacter takamatsuzukensis]